MNICTEKDCKEMNCEMCGCENCTSWKEDRELYDSDHGQAYGSCEKAGDIIGYGWKIINSVIIGKEELIN